MRCEDEQGILRKLVKENLDWLHKQGRTLEREHIISIVENSVSHYYPAPIPEPQNDHFDQWLSAKGFEGPKGSPDTECFYECPGGHVWPECEVVKLYEEERDEGE